ncbi:branched-chain amino acid ABC transporter substrate-binding protein [Rhizobium laguerreae]|uniref:branched-chain amino acid ABC transporter substrate-binding protein n=1 Tax=Rhizobium laguerreae TaxID=1076926 RepID=UPI0035E42882
MVALLLSAIVLFSSTFARADILVGVAGPLTGPDSEFGAQIQKGAELAAADINLSGGINGEQIKIVLGDDVSDPKQGISVANKFMADGVKFVIGHFSSGVSIPASDVYAENGILMISPGSTNPILTGRGLWNTFRTSSNDRRAAELAAEYISENYANKEVWIIHDGSESAKAITAVVRDALSVVGRSATRYSSFNDLSGSGANDKVVFYYGFEELPKVSMRLANASADGELISLASPGFPLLTLDGRNAVDKMKMSGFVPDRYALQAYAAMQVLAKASEIAGSTETHGLAAALKAGTLFTTAIGDISFDANGDNDKTEIAISKTPITADWGIASAGVSRVCGTTCPASCNGTCPNGDPCCNVASFQVR